MPAALTWNLAAALAPLLVLVLGLAALNLPTFRAALGALAVLAAVTAWRTPLAGLPGLWGRAGLDALLLAATVGYTLFFGLLLYRLLRGGGALETLLAGSRTLGRTPLERLLWVLLVFGPLFESITGFGLGIVIAVPMLQGLGYAPQAVAALALLSQLAVPWGALAIGMALGAGLTGLSFAAMGVAAAVLNLPVPLVFGVMALRLAGIAPRPGALARIALAAAVFGAGVWAANRWVSVELGGIAGPLAVAAWLWATGAAAAGSAAGTAPAGPPVRSLLRSALPAAALVALLAGTRLVEPLRAWLARTLVLRLPGSAIGLPLLYNPGASLLVACAVAVWAAGLSRSGVRRAVGETWHQWWPTARAIGALLLVARAMTEGGLAAVLGQAGRALPTPVASSATAALGALGGFLTGSVAAANAMFLELALELGPGAGSAQAPGLGGVQAPGAWLAGGFVVLAAGFTAFSPVRLVFAAVMTGQHGQEGALLRRLAPLALALLAWGALALSPSVLGALYAMAVPGR